MKLNRILLGIELVLLTVSLTIATLWIILPSRDDYEPWLAACTVLLVVLEFVRRIKKKRVGEQELTSAVRASEAAVFLELLGADEVFPLGSLLSLKGGGLELSDVFGTVLRGRLRLENAGSPTSLRIFLRSFSPRDSSHLLGADEVAPALFDPSKARFNNPYQVENPYRLRSDEIVELDFEAKIRLDRREVESACGAAGNFRELEIELVAEQTRKQPLVRKFTIDLTPVHFYAEKELSNWMPQLWRDRKGPSASQVLGVLRRYWAGPLQETKE